MKTELRNKVLLVLLGALAAGLLCAHLRMPRNVQSYLLTESSAAGRSGESMQTAVCSGEVDVNRAAAQELCKLPGVGQTLAQEIISEREANGDFHYPEDLVNVKGIGEKMLEKMRRQLRLP